LGGDVFVAVEDDLRPERRVTDILIVRCPHSGSQI
jgi:hypothetical protein